MRDTGIRSLQVLCMASVTYETLGQVHVLQCAVCCMLHVLWCVPYRASCLLLAAGCSERFRLGARLLCPHLPDYISVLRAVACGIGGPSVHSLYLSVAPESIRVHPAWRASGLGGNGLQH